MGDKHAAGHEPALADAGGGLLAGEVLGAAAQAEQGESGGDGAGGDEDDLLAPGAAVLGEDAGEGVHPVGVQADGGGQRRGAIHASRPATTRSSSTRTNGRIAPRSASET
ncbi:hypothetical protein ACE1SV_58510 [Streptomyces sennicomposti]